MIALTDRHHGRRPGAHIAVNGVSHRFRRNATYALTGVDFEIQPCEAVALVGRSGCGKSTLLHIMSGLMAPTRGDVRLDGALVQGPTPECVVMFQQPHLFPWMTVAQSVGLGLKFAGRPKSEINERVRELLALVELDGYEKRNVQDLSGGQQQRVALARSLAVHPEVLFLDEPFSALDLVTRRALQQDVRRIAREIGITLVIVTHDIPEAVTMADRAIVMSPNPGRVYEIVPIEIDDADRVERSAAAQAAQERLQKTFEAASGRTIELAAAREASVEPLRLAAAGHR